MKLIRKSKKSKDKDSTDLDLLRTVKEDILEVVGRAGGKILLRIMKPEIAVSQSTVTKAVEKLEEENLVEIIQGKEASEKYIHLTEEGQNRADTIIEKHSVLENYFKEKRRDKREAIEATNILEHYISSEVLDNIKKLASFQKEGTPITEYTSGEGFITDIKLNGKLFERIISMGIYPGEKIRIIRKIPNAVIIEVDNKKFALDRDIACHIKVLKNENA